MRKEKMNWGEFLLKLYIITSIFIITILAVTILPSLKESIRPIYAITIMIMNTSGIFFIIFIWENEKKNK